MSRSIGETASAHGVPAHVLRHWEDAGALTAARTGSGHRRYDAEHDSQIELIKCGKVAGLSLAQIAVVLHGSPEEREPLLRQRIADLDRLAAEIEAAQRLLHHVLNCDSGMACEQCAHPHGSFGFPPDG